MSPFPLTSTLHLIRNFSIFLMFSSMAPPTLGYKTQLLNLHSKVQIALLDAFNPHWAQIPFPYLTAPSLKNILFILFF